MKYIPSLICAFLLISAIAPPASAQICLPIGYSESVVIGSGLHNPVGMAFLPDGRLLVIQQGNNTNADADDDAKIKLWDDPTLTDLLTMSEVNTGGERGLLGIAPHPGFPAPPYIFVFYTNASPTKVQIARYTIDNPTDSPPSFSINAASKVILLHDMPDERDNHNGGTLRFGPDGRLYASLGDDAKNRCDAQDLTILAGKILRLNIDGIVGPGEGPDVFDPATDRGLLDPGDNPDSGEGDNRSLVWDRGLRNPFRFSIDPTTGRLYIGDVGSGIFEEATEGGTVADHATEPGNFAWPAFEGNHDRNEDCGAPEPANPTPMFVIDHDDYGALSIMGGPVYRGNPYPNEIAGDMSFPLSFEGVYFASEYYQGFLEARRQDSGSWVALGNCDIDLGADGIRTYFATGLAGGSSDWTVGPDGALYYVSQWTDSVRKISYTGDFDRDEIPDGTDSDDDNDGLTDAFELTQTGYHTKDTDSDDDGIMDSLDFNLGDPGNACNGANAVYNDIVNPMDITCAASESVTTASEVQNGRLFRVISTNAILGPNFKVAATSRLSVISVDPGALP